MKGARVDGYSPVTVRRASLRPTATMEVARRVLCPECGFAQGRHARSCDKSGPPKA